MCLHFYRSELSWRWFRGHGCIFERGWMEIKVCHCMVYVEFHRRYRRTYIYDIFRGCIVVISTGALSYVDISRLYHAIRGQEMIKLYVLFTMIEVHTVEEQTWIGFTARRSLTSCVVHWDKMSWMPYTLRRDFSLNAKCVFS